MRFLILEKATARSEAGGLPPEPPRAAFHEALARAGVLLDAQCLRPSREGWRIDYGDGPPRRVDGPFPDAGELLAGYALIDVPSVEAALEWSRRFPSGVAGQIEVRRVDEPDNLPTR